jgi:hypothetical protein
VAAGILHLPVESAATTALRRRSNPMPISVPNYCRNTDRFQFGMLIDITLVQNSFELMKKQAPL